MRICWFCYGHFLDTGGAFPLRGVVMSHFRSVSITIGAPFCSALCAGPVWQWLGWKAPPVMVAHILSPGTGSHMLAAGEQPFLMFLIVLFVNVIAKNTNFPVYWKRKGFYVIFTIGNPSSLLYKDVWIPCWEKPIQSSFRMDLCKVELYEMFNYLLRYFNTKTYN